jgi:hypothetical protein
MSPIGRDVQRCLMMEAAPALPFEVAKANLLFEFVVVALNAPAQFGGADSCRTCQKFLSALLNCR